MKVIAGLLLIALVYGVWSGRLDLPDVPGHHPSATSSSGEYDRAQFGQRWADVDRNGCGTRDDILARDLTGVVKRGRCVVVAGTLHDPYTGATIVFTKAHADAVQIDHVVPLAEAWRTGADRWTPARRLAFANDPGNLLAVDGPTNMGKGDDGPDRWLPPNTAERCDYLNRYLTVKTRYGLTIRPAETAAAAAARCPR